VDPFDVLGIEPDASADDIARAYRREAKRWHPDRGHWWPDF
jgi:curved DNA-binding protein CbpA